jgi:dTDP-4-amino-4,6-dideoxygalactose transaminase
MFKKFYYGYLTTKFNRTTFPRAEEIAQTRLSLPLYPGLKEEQILYVCDAIQRFFKGA